MWQKIRVGAFAEIGRGSSPRPIKDLKYFEGGTIPWIKIADATKSGKYLYATKQYVNELGASFSRKLSPRSLIVAASGTLGYTQLLGVEGCVHDGWLYFKSINTDVADIDFLYYVFNYRQQFFYNAAYGAAIQNINTTILSDMELDLPPLATQRKIAVILSAYDDLIENNNKRIKLLEQAAHDLYREWFVHFRFPGHEDVEMVDSGTDYGKIPRGWEVCLLSDIIDTQYGYTESSQNEPVGPKFLRGKDINKASYIDWSQVPYCPITDENFMKFQLSFGDVIMIRMADPGKVAIVERDKIDAVFASYLVRWKIRHSIMTPYFLFYFLSSNKYQSYITGASTGTTRRSASAKVMTGKEILMPTESLLQLFDDLIVSFRNELSNLLDRNVILRTTRDLLLPRLVSGELDVSELEIQGAK